MANITELLDRSTDVSNPDFVNPTIVAVVVGRGGMHCPLFHLVDVICLELT